MPREEDPYFKIPGFTVAAIYPGADPKDLERLIAKPLEDRFAALDDVLKMETSIRDGVSFTAIEFLASTDADKKYDEVTRELNALRPEFPPDVHIIVRRFSPGLVNTVQIALLSDGAPYRELEDYARELKDKLKTVEGVRTSESWAFPRTRTPHRGRPAAHVGAEARAGPDHRRRAKREREHSCGLRRPRPA